MDFITVAMASIGPLNSGFFVPLFSSLKSDQLHVQEVDKKFRITDFIPIDQDGSVIGEIPHRMRRKVGDDALFGFATDKHVNLIGTPTEIAADIIAHTKKTKDEFLRDEINDFLILTGTATETKSSPAIKQSNFVKQRYKGEHQTQFPFIHEEDSGEEASKEKAAREKVSKEELYDVPLKSGSGFVTNAELLNSKMISDIGAKPIFFVTTNPNLKLDARPALLNSENWRAAASLIPNKWAKLTNGKEFESITKRDLSSYDSGSPLPLSKALLIANILYHIWLHRTRDNKSPEFVRVEPAIFKLEFGKSGILSASIRNYLRTELKGLSEVSGQPGACILDSIAGYLVTEPVGLDIIFALKSDPVMNSFKVRLVSGRDNIIGRFKNGTRYVCQGLKTKW